MVEEEVIVEKPIVVEEKTKEGTPNTGITFDITLYSTILFFGISSLMMSKKKTY